MCGICGVISKKKQIDKGMFEQMVDIVAHRGPDDRGTYYDAGVALGHRRLAIIDLSSEGHQPFLYHDRYVVVFNGEIYNYKELRKELEEKKYHFQTQTDTEVLAAMYDCYGKECVCQLNGMWAFAIYDKDERTLFCSRDRFGVKPFYYYDEDGEFLFSSEIKQILTMLPRDKKIYANRERLADFLVLGELDCTDETMFADIKQLRGGYNLFYNVEQHDFVITCYYDIANSYSRKARKQDYEKACLEFKGAFEKSVRYRLQADVPVGYCLSGGMDSSSIVCMANHILKKENTTVEQKAFSSCFEDKAYDEQEYIDEVIRKTGIASFKVFPQEERLFTELDRMIWHMDEPFGSTSTFAACNVFHLAKENGVTVVLDGQGADEYLMGYTGCYPVLFAYYLRRFQLIRFIREVHYYRKCRAKTEKYVSVANIILNAIVSAYLPNKMKLYIQKATGYGYNYLPLSSKLIKEVLKNRKSYRVNDPYYFSIDMLKGELSSLLHYEDRESMAYSIESRVPFLDYHLVESVMSMPINHKIRKGMTKSVLRDGLEGILPDKIRGRISKLGFVTPEDKWINENYDVFRKELAESCHYLKGLVDEKKVLEWFEENKGKIRRADFFVWRVICAGHWMRIFNVSLKN